MSIAVDGLRWVKYSVGTDGFVCLVDVMGDDAAICDAARVSYGAGTQKSSSDETLIRYLYRHGHLSPFEMVEFKFLVRVPMDVWRQWIRHRTANVNEYSTRYSEAINSCAKTPRGKWRLQSADNKQGSIGYLPIETPCPGFEDQMLDGTALSKAEDELHDVARRTYEQRLRAGVAREQARKDLPLSTYTEAYWKIDLRNLLNFLSLRLDPHAQLEIREYASAIYQIVKKVCPLTIAAFDDYDSRRNGLLLSATEITIIRHMFRKSIGKAIACAYELGAMGVSKELLEAILDYVPKEVVRQYSSISALQRGMFSTTLFYDTLRDTKIWPVPPEKCRERDECLKKLITLGFINPELPKEEGNNDVAA
jgi:thymidylate synthase (FAD)